MCNCGIEGGKCLSDCPCSCHKYDKPSCGRSWHLKYQGDGVTVSVEVSAADFYEAIREAEKKVKAISEKLQIVSVN